MITIGERLANARRAAGLSQSALASRVGLTPQTISLYERGRLRPGTQAAVRIADALQIDVRTLVDPPIPATGTDPA